MPAELFRVKLLRENAADTWGFNLSGGGEQLLAISEIEVGGTAEQSGLIVGDVITQINADRVDKRPLKEAEELIKKSSNELNLQFIRNLDNLIEDPRYQDIKPKDRKKVGFHDVLKPVLRKDWNCPWVKRDGKGLKNVVRNYFGDEPVPAPIKTSYNHFYSEPQSILAPEPTQEALAELERILQEKLAQETEEKLRQQKLQQAVKQPVQTKQEVLVEPEVHQRQVEQVVHHVVDREQDVQMKEVESPMPVEDHPRVEEEEDFCPALETIETHHQEEAESIISHQEVFQDFADNQSLFAAIARAIQSSMEQYQTSSEGFEPSADELIDVLKNLENLAAANPALYRAIVDQIKVHQPSQRQENHETHIPEYEDQEVPNLDQESYSEQAYENGYESHEANGLDGLDQEQVEQLKVEESAFDEENSERIKREQRAAKIQQEVEQEHQAQMNMLKRQGPRPQVVDPEPPKTITVVAGSRNQAAWPIAPGVSNGTTPRSIELTASSAETMEELMKNRIEVAQAAGLRHVEVIHGDETFYPQPMKDYDYPWAGSLRPVSNKLLRRDHANRRGSDVDPTPWSGSLRHVEEKKRQKTKHQDEDDTYGNAPWMGTLKHVKHENKVKETLKPQFKRYPDEDAPNPYSSTQGKSAKPCYPLTPAAVISASGGSKEERERARQDEEVDRIRSNLRETRTVSSALLKALMPKLLKEHQSKYEPLDHMESIRIMEEILGMQIGLNTSQSVDDNDEADQMIRAIEMGDIDKQVYSKMADDLELAAQIKKGGEKKKKKKKVTSKGNTKELAPEIGAN